MFADPSKDTPPIFLAVSSAVAVAALPVISSLAVMKPAPLVIALLFRDMFADPSKATPAMVFVAASFVAVAALPVVS